MLLLLQPLTILTAFSRQNTKGDRLPFNNPEEKIKRGIDRRGAKERMHRRPPSMKKKSSGAPLSWVSRQLLRKRNLESKRHKPYQRLSPKTYLSKRKTMSSISEVDSKSSARTINQCRETTWTISILAPTSFSPNKKKKANSISILMAAVEEPLLRMNLRTTAVAWTSWISLEE